MKLRESGMPEEGLWETLFDVGLILDRLGIDDTVQDIVELGCGYGTFTSSSGRPMVLSRLSMTFSSVQGEHRAVSSRLRARDEPDREAASGNPTPDRCGLVHGRPRRDAAGLRAPPS